METCLKKDKIQNYEKSKIAIITGSEGQLENFYKNFNQEKISCNRN